jgi:argininosuccinate synthase
MVALVVEMASEKISYLPATARKNDAKGLVHGATSKGADSSSP